MPAQQVYQVIAVWAAALTWCIVFLSVIYLDLKFILKALLLLLLFPMAASAQTSTCIGPTTTALTVPVGVPVFLGVCHSYKDIAGSEVSNLSNLKVLIDDVEALNVSLQPTPLNADRSVEFRVGPYTFTPGPHVMKVSVSSTWNRLNPDGSVTSGLLEWSAPLAVQINGTGIPTPPPVLSPPCTSIGVPTISALVTSLVTADGTWTLGTLDGPNGSKALLLNGVQINGAFVRRATVGPDGQLYVVGDGVPDAWFVYAAGSFASASAPNCAPTPPPTCTFTLGTPTGGIIPATGGSGAVTVTTTCPFTPTSDQSWLTATASTPVGSTSSVQFTAAPNVSTTVRVATLKLGTAAVQITQAAAVDPCATTPSITVFYFTPSLRVGRDHGLFGMYVTPPVGRTIVRVQLEIAGAIVGTVLNPDINTFGGIQYVPTTQGTKTILARAFDNLGCRGSTLSPRSIKVLP